MPLTRVKPNRSWYMRRFRRFMYHRDDLTETALCRDGPTIGLHLIGGPDREKPVDDAGDSATENLERPGREAWAFIEWRGWGLLAR